MGAEEIGKVHWSWETSSPGGAGYRSGLEELARENPLFAKHDGAVYFFCRNVGIAVTNPGKEEDNVVKKAADLIREGMLTQKQLDYIYQQFGFEPVSYKPPSWWKP